MKQYQLFPRRNHKTDLVTSFHLVSAIAILLIGLATHPLAQVPIPEYYGVYIVTGGKINEVVDTLHSPGPR